MFMQDASLKAGYASGLKAYGLDRLGLKQVDGPLYGFCLRLLVTGLELVALGKA